MVEYSSLIISGMGAIIAIAVAWGGNNARLSESEKWRADMEKRIDSFTSKEHCLLKHSFTDKIMDEIKGDIREIKEILRELAADVGRAQNNPK